MIVALHITSESGDHYLELYKDKSIKEIHENLVEGGESFYGCNIESSTLECTSTEDEELKEMLRKFEKESWEFY